MPEPALTQMIREYLWATAAYWWVLVPGALMPLRDVLKLLKIIKDNRQTPRWLELSVVFACLSIAQFLAYRNKSLNLAIVIEEKRQFSIKVDALNASVRKEEQKNAGMPKTFKEPSDSLRRRTMGAADELREYVKKRMEEHPPAAYPNSNDPNPSEERKKAIQICQKYDQETLDYYLKHFRDRMVGIVKEYEAKGVPTRYLENDFKQRVPGVAFIGSDWEGSAMDELSQFRDLAYRVDARDHLIVF